MSSKGVDTVFFLGSIFGVPLKSYRLYEDVLCKELMQMERAKACKASRYTWQDQIEFQKTKLYQVRDTFDRKADGQKQNKP